MTFTLRPYQEQAIAACYDYLRAQSGNPLIVLPTGAGKSPVLAQICKDSVLQWGGRVLVLTHVKELVEQNAATLHRLWGAELGKGPVGVYSAGLGMRDTEEPVIVAGIQSVYSKGIELGRFDLVIVDEAQSIPADGDGMYRTLLGVLKIINPNIRMIGLTATPYRLTSGFLYGKPESLFTGIAYEIGVRELIDAGFLSHLRGKNGGDPDLSGVHTRGGEYISGELESAMSDSEKVTHAAAEIVKHGANRCAWLVFCCGVKHANLVKEELSRLINCMSHSPKRVDPDGDLWHCTKCGAAEVEMGLRNCSGVNQVAVVLGDTPSDERAETIRAFKKKELRCIINVGVLTTGFDAPHVDMVVMLRPTKSPGLYYQIVGRGLRIAEGKKDCLVLDLAGNIAEHGPVDDIRIKEKRDGKKGGDAPTKTCPECQEIIYASAVQCNQCGFLFPKDIAKHAAKAGDETPLIEYRQEDVEVVDAYWSVHRKKGSFEGDGVPKTLMVSYCFGYQQTVSEWICFEHAGFARNKAVIWWENHTGLPGHMTPTTALEALDRLDILQKADALRLPSKLTLRFGGKWPEIVNKEYAGPVPVALGEVPTIDDDRVATWSDDEPPF